MPVVGRACRSRLSLTSILIVRPLHLTVCFNESAHICVQRLCASAVQTIIKLLLRSCADADSCGCCLLPLISRMLSRLGPCAGLLDGPSKFSSQSVTRNFFALACRRCYEFRCADMVFQGDQSALERAIR